MASCGEVVAIVSDLPNSKISPSRRRLARHCAMVLLMAVIFTGVGQGQAQDLSLLREVCFLKPWQDFGHEYGELRRVNPRIRGLSVRLRFRNPSWHHHARICIYDSICRAIRYRGILSPGSDLRIEACANAGRRGSIIVLEAYGKALLYDNVPTGTINLPYRRSRR